MDDKKLSGTFQLPCRPDGLVSVDGFTQAMATVGTSESQIDDVFLGHEIEFASQPGKWYPVLSVTPKAIVLANPYTGPLNGDTTARVR